MRGCGLLLVACSAALGWAACAGEDTSSLALEPGPALSDASVDVPPLGPDNAPSMSEVAGDTGPLVGCPADGPTGGGVGAVLPDLAFVTCEGEPYTVHELCGGAAGWVYAFFGW